MRDFALLYINGERHEVSGEWVFRPLSDYLRYLRGLTGTKVVCAEGDCGACSVLHVQTSLGFKDFLPINSCITIPALLDGSHIITVEGVGEGDKLHPIQEAFVKNHGAQCGFCTPGFICTLAGLYENKSKVDEKAVRNALTGNLCRCTGYDAILKSALEVDGKKVSSLKKRHHTEEVIKDLLNSAKDPLEIEHDGIRFYAPTHLEALLEYKAEFPNARVVSSATDVGVQVNKGFSEYKRFCSLGRIPESYLCEDQEEQVSVGAKVSLTNLEHAVENDFPEFANLLHIFASPQIKNVATLIGNVMNGSPIGDTLPFLYVMGAKLKLQSRTGERLVDINDFFKGYKQMDISPKEVVTEIQIPKLARDEVVKLYKVSRRKDLDISCVTAGYRLQKDDQKIVKAHVAYGGVGPTIVRLPKVEEFLAGKDFSQETCEEAGEMSSQSVAPLSDVRGSEEYRRKLVKNLFLKMYHDESCRTKSAS